MTDFDYAAMAEVYSGRGSARSRSIRYNRFDTAADALRFVNEVLPGELRTSAVMESNEERFKGAQIVSLYNDLAYPLVRQ